MFFRLSATQSDFQYVAIFIVSYSYLKIYHISFSKSSKICLPLCRRKKNRK
ncbi:hypothetical protein EUBSIR_00051 [[Eubacterium] siraeum DSM 15702]|uniref:Uncharacterized protein n=1 Tax=[Eubacterium] siraeum DSM 15702 TaxID=428128 RepID=B0MJS7_9FIRM|nr:hypothetical protein EUBSIR_00051 [[Eubacterium] siraeum DSM 15702]